MEFLPNVCDPGQSCRDKRWVLLQDELKDLWAEMMVSIDSKITIGRTSTKVLINKAYEAAYACKPGCSCENISIEYDQIIKWQENLSTRVIEYTSILSGLITEETTIITSCPAYIYDSDGNAYFDYQAPVVVVAPVVAAADSIYDGESAQSTDVKASAPDVPSSPTTANSGTNVVITWSAPFYNGGTITSYTVTIMDSRGSTWTEDLVNCDGSDSSIVSATQCTIPQSVLTYPPYFLSSGDFVFARVVATNVHGSSEASNMGSGATII